MPAALEQNIANLGIYILNETREILLDPVAPARLDAFININRQLAMDLPTTHRIERMPLRLNVKPGERIFLGTSSFVINNEGTIGLVIDGTLPLLRETDYIWPKDANTPLRQFYCALQASYLTGRADDGALAQTSKALFDDGLPAEKLAEISLAILSGELFKALKAARKLLVEQESADQWADVVRYSPEGFMQ